MEETEKEGPAIEVLTNNDEPHEAKEEPTKREPEKIGSPREEIGIRPFSENVNNEDQSNVVQPNCLGNETIVICGVCAYGFENVQECTEHMLSHSETMIYKCDQCDCTFDTKPNLESHSVTNHVQTKPVNKQVHRSKCTECRYQTVNENELKVHTLSKHETMKVNIDIADHHLSFIYKLSN